MAKGCAKTWDKLRSGYGVFRPGLAATTPGSSAGQLDEIRRLTQALEEERLQIGECPATPPTLRGRLGAGLIRFFGRWLWWYSHRLSELFARVVEGQAEIARILDSHFASHAFSLDTRLRALESVLMKLPSADGLAESADRRAAPDGGLFKPGRQRADELESQLAGLQMRLTMMLRSVEDNTVRLARLERNLAALPALPSTTLETPEFRTPVSDPASEALNRIADLSLEINKIRGQIGQQDARVTKLLREARRRLPEPFDEAQLAQFSKHADQHLDQVYMAFEDAFRNSREEIRERQSVYVPMLQRARAGTAGRPILDLGSGRGEWLELLRDQGIEASGVDSNESMIACCRSLGLKVEKNDFLQHLASVPDSSLGAVTAFQLVEHLSFEKIFHLIDETLRVLRPGGLIILETPNPENVQVATHIFYLDPTHVRPIPSLMLQFFVKARGFVDVAIAKLHPDPDWLPVSLPEVSQLNRLDHFFYGPRDYAVIGRKPA